MKKSYLFAPVVILVILIVSFFSSYASAQNKQEDVQVIKVKKQMKTASGDDSVKVIIKTIEINEETGEETVNIDSLVHILTNELGIDNGKQLKVIEIIDGDTTITHCWNDSLADIWIHKFEADEANLDGKLKKHRVFISDSSMKLEYKIDFEFDSLLDPLNKIDIHTLASEDFVTIEELIETELENGETEKEIKIIMHHPDSNIIFINDDGKNIRIERKGEMVFINKEKNVKNVDSLLEVIEDEDGHKVIVVQTRIVLDELTEEETEGLKAQGLKTSKKEPEFDFVKFYPNPAKEGINLNFKLAEQGTTEVKISNMIGQVVFEEKMNNFEGEYNRNIGLKENGSGTYILQIIQGKRVISKKIIVE